MNHKRFISIILFSFCLVACKSDDNDDNETANYSTAILGSWQYQGSKDVEIYTKDEVYYGLIDNASFRSTSYSLKGDTLRCPALITTYEVIAIDKNTMYRKKQGSDTTVIMKRIIINN